MNIFVGCSSRDVTDNVKWSRYCTATLEVTKFITARISTLSYLAVVQEALWGLCTNVCYLIKPT